MNSGVSGEALAAGTATAAAPTGRAVLTPKRVFILLGLIAALSIIGFRGQSLVLERSHVLQQRQAQAATLAQFAATYSARLYDESSRLAQDVADKLRAGDLTDAQLHDYLAMRVKDTTANDYIVVLDATGHLRATSEDPSPASVNFSSPDLANRWKNPEQEIVPMLRSRLTGAVIYSLGQRLEDSRGAFSGIVGVNVRPEGIRPTDKRRPEDPMLMLWDQDGRFVAASFVDFDKAGRAIPPPMPGGISVPGSARQASPDALIASTPVQGWPLVAVASYDRAGVLAAWRRSLYETIALVVLALLGIGALVWLGMKTADRETSAKTALEHANAVAAEALADRDLLLKEVDHRVKNSLMMTSSLIYLQERRFNDPEVREAFESTRRRLNSIGLVHEALYSGSSLQDLDLADYLTRLLADLTEAYGGVARGVTVHTEIEPLSLPASQATPVGLIVAEVITNAFKHAFKDRTSGRIDLTVRRLGLAEVEVEIRDDGDGYPTPGDETRGGLGARLIEALREQLRGTLSMTSDNGAVFRLTFPVQKR